MFKISVGAPFRIQSAISGFLTVAEVREYAANMLEVYHLHCRFAPTYRLVIDASAAKIQSQDVIKAFEEHIAGFPPAERVGVVVGRSLNRYQALRLLDRPHVNLCDLLEEAQQWAFGATIPESALRLVAENKISRAA